MHSMKVGLFIPCYIDQFYPRVGLAVADVLSRAGIDFEYPREQTCCGQPMLNSGCADDARRLAQRFVSVFRRFDSVVCPSGSCVSMVRNHFHDLIGDDDVCTRTFEFCEFLSQYFRGPWEGRFPHRVGWHAGCHGLRELRLGGASELMEDRDDVALQLLSELDQIQIVHPARRDECCGFGGTFAITEHGVSAMMGEQRVDAFTEVGAEVIASGDMSCLMHLEGIIRRRNLAIRVMHIAEILADASTTTNR
jgi:L-lactate dehydrogenase complex protein LldE